MQESSEFREFRNMIAEVSAFPVGNRFTDIDTTHILSSSHIVAASQEELRSSVLLWNRLQTTGTFYILHDVE